MVRLEKGAVSLSELDTAGYGGLVTATAGGGSASFAQVARRKTGSTQLSRTRPPLQ